MLNLSICSIMKELNKVVMKNTTHFLSEDAVWESVSEFVSVVACRRAGVHDRLLLGTYRQMIVGTGDVPGAVNFIRIVVLNTPIGWRTFLLTTTITKWLKMGYY